MICLLHCQIPSQLRQHIVFLAVVYMREWTYVHGTAAVVLNNFVAGLVCATADNPGFLAGFVPFLCCFFRNAFRFGLVGGTTGVNSQL